MSKQAGLISPRLRKVDHARKPINPRDQPAISPQGGQIWTQPTSGSCTSQASPCPLCLSCTNPIGLTADPIPLPILAAPVDDLWPNAPHSGSHDSCRCGWDPSPITPQLVTLISEKASCRVTEQELGRKRMDEEKRRRCWWWWWGAVQWCMEKAVEARTRPNTTSIALITLTQTSKKRKWCMQSFYPDEGSEFFCFHYTLNISLLQEIMERGKDSLKFKRKSIYHRFFFFALNFILVSCAT